MATDVMMYDDDDDDVKRYTAKNDERLTAINNFEIVDVDADKKKQTKMNQTKE